MVYSGCGKIIYAWRRGSELKHTYVGHESKVQLLLPFGPFLISVDAKSFVKVSIEKHLVTFEWQGNLLKMRIPLMTERAKRKQKGFF